MRQPRRHANDRRSPPADSVRKPHAIGSGAEANLLLHSRKGYFGTARGPAGSCYHGSENARFDGRRMSSTFDAAPKVNPESRTLGSNRNELGALLVQAGLGSPRDHALISLLAMNGLRISEALGADIDDLDVDTGHRTLRVVRKGGKQTTIPLAPRTARALDLYIGERATGPIFLAAGGGRMDRYAADRTVKRLARRAGITKPISPHSLRHSFITAALDAASRCGTYKRPPRTPTRAPPCATTEHASPSTVTPPTSSPPSSPAPPPDIDSTTGRYRAPISPGRAGGVGLARPEASGVGRRRSPDIWRSTTLVCCPLWHIRRRGGTRRRDDRWVKRVSVVGNSGSGKTTLSRRLAAGLGVPHIELDAIFHQAGWTELPVDEFRGASPTNCIATTAGWSTATTAAVRDLVWAAADTVVWFDLSRSTVMRRLVWRTVRRAVTREELWNSNREPIGGMFRRDPRRTSSAGRGRITPSAPNATPPPRWILTTRT